MLQRFPSGGKLCTETLVNFDRNIQQKACMLPCTAWIN